MDAQRMAEALRSRFGASADVFVRSEKRLYLRVDPGDAADVFLELRRTVPGFRLSTATGIDLREGVGVFYHFVVNGGPLVLTMKVLARRPALEVPSLASLLPAAKWIEREIAEMLGVRFLEHPDPRRLLKSRCLPDHVYPLRRDFVPQSAKEIPDERPAP